MRPHVHILVLALAVLSAAASGKTNDERKAAASKGTAAPPLAVAHLESAEGKAIGDAILRETPNGVLITLKLTGLSPGTHAFHVHERGKCEPPFESAGGHFNPGKKLHGFAHAAGYHAGDLPNIHVPANGEITAEFLARDVTLAPGKANSLLDGDGSALVVHARADDYRSDPTGASGDRIACGAVERAVAAPATPRAGRPAAGTR
jgi:Cu-Zn family superoxide dismutase